MPLFKLYGILMLLSHVSPLSLPCDAASGEADFTAHSVELTFTPDGPTQFTIPITIINDIFLEYDRENFSSIVSLSSASDAIIIMPSQATINIIDDDSE